ncbi:MAG: tRNA (adenosine(37)-N6)-threonylcarbamoyltransferase complex dimerization subunit type 1 TsaB, partial [Clostridiales bacterium]|nr:tRNA (adenosine(37)-N6)-threonylcarbamoyltransferase complex dimerization subunit type 1 TsaB [Clostridiales bacterium]
MMILAIDSSAAAASAALVEDGKVLGEFYINT